MFASKDLFFSKPSGYQISRSVRLRSSASAYLSRTPSVAGNQKTWTFSAWVKRGTLSANGWMLGAGTSTDYAGVFFTASGNLQVNCNTSSTQRIAITSVSVFRDPSAWYHVVAAIDTTQATNSNGVKIYVNGVQQTLTYTLYTQNVSTAINNTVAQAIGQVINVEYFDGYMTEVNLIDGQALTPSSFGETDSITGVWKPKKYTGTYGTNGFYLNFSDNSAATAAAIGKDYSGNGNNWTPNNISVTAGVTYDSMLDVPTLFADGGNGRGNYCVINPLDKGSSGTISDGNLATSSQTASANGTFGLTTGKWYFEASFSSITGASSLVEVGIQAINIQGYLSSGNKDLDTAQTAYGATYTTSDIIGCAFDLDAKQMTFYKNGTSQGTFTYTVADTYFPMIRARGTTTFAGTINFGQRPFTYTPPTGFKALNTQNLPTPTISKGNQYFDVSLYTGNNSARSVTNNGGFQPDLVWLKGRSVAYNHYLYDSVRGALKELYSDSTSAEFTATQTMTAFNSNGFSLGTDNGVNQNAQTYVGWQWKAGGTSSSNTNGSITSTVSVGSTQGFSVVTYTGTGANATVGHGLGVAPRMVIVKRRDAGGYSWIVGMTVLGWNNYMVLNQTIAAGPAPTVWNSTAPTSNVFSVGTDTFVNASGGTYVAYCFSEVAGFSKFGSYTGNGSADGPFVYCGFRPKFVMYKRTDTTSNWIMLDTSINPANNSSTYLQPNLSAAEGTDNVFDILSNGFKLRNGGATSNASGGTYIFAAFAETPTKFSLAR